VHRPAAVDAIWVGDARDMDAHGTVADDSVALVVTSPPCFAGKEYEQAMGVGHDPAAFAAYLDMLHDVFAQCFTKLQPGGRIAVNVANLGRKPYRSLARDVIDILEGLGFLLRGEIVWQKSHAGGGSCAGGTYRRPGNPVLRDVSERIIELYTYRGELVLDPFMGSGTTALAAVRAERHLIGFDTDPEYVALAQRRTAEERATGPGDVQRVTVAPGRTAGAADAVGDAPGFIDLGVAVDHRARDARGGVWLFLLTGVYSATRPGPKRADVPWRALGAAAVLHEAWVAEPGCAGLGPLVLPSTDVPPPGSAGGRALHTVPSEAGPVRDVCELLDLDATDRLAAHGSGPTR